MCVSPGSLKALIRVSACALLSTHVSRVHAGVGSRVYGPCVCACECVHF